MNCKNTKISKIATIILAVILCFSAFVFVGCSQPNQTSENGTIANENNELLVIVIPNDFEHSADYKLSDYMESEKQKGNLVFEVSNGFVSSINGISNNTFANKYWMLYTSDENYSNSAWGVYEYDGKSYSSSTIGIEQPIKNGETYIWVYSQL